jgi:hypothetical protein
MARQDHDELDASPRHTHRPDAIRQRNSALCTSSVIGTVRTHPGILSDPDYSRCRDWAALWQRAGLGGVSYAPNFDPRDDKWSYALFGRTGERTTYPRGQAQLLATE